MYGGDKNRYHGNRRGNRGYKRGPHHQGQRYSRNGDGADEGRQYEREHDQSGSGGARGRGRPPGLRGKDIGMYYARMGRAKRASKDRAQRPVVNMGSRQEAHIENLLHNIRANEACPPQPHRSGADPDQDDWFDVDTKERVQSPHSKQRVQSPHSHRKYNYSSVKEKLSPPGAASTSLEDDSLPGPSRLAAEDDTDIMIDLTEEDTEVEKNVATVSELIKYNTEEDYMIKEENFDAFLDEAREDEMLNDEMRDDFLMKLEDKKYKEMLKFRKKLPANDKRWEILDLVSKNQVVVISGETGCGKTTQVPQFILDDYLERGIGTECRIFCTQPRRISAVSVSERVAAERAEKLGHSTGYMIRLEHKMPRHKGSILFCTTGILLRLLEADPLLERASHIVLDEIHERDLLSDFLIIILRDILQRRPNLKLILMSATLNAEAFSKYFSNCPMLNIPGFTYPVKEYVLEDVIDILGYEPNNRMLKQNRRRGGKNMRGGRKYREQLAEEEWNLQAWLRNIEQDYSPSTIDTLERYDTSKIDVDLIYQLIRYICTQKEDGAILTFVPGWAEISDLNKLLVADPLFESSRFRIIPLHSLMPTLNQREVFERPPAGVRKIVIATNIAETSITIDDVVYVVDGGRIKVKDYNAETNLSSLAILSITIDDVVYVVDGGRIKVKDYNAETNLSSLATQWVSKANAKQRKGRAGRVQPGECYHLYSGLQENMLQDYLPPEILRTRLEELCLQIKLLKLGRIEPFVKKAMQAPSLQSLHNAIINLQNLNALDDDENLLPLGYHLARMPLDPQVGKMILFAAIFSCLDPILTVAASLSFKDAFIIPLGKEKLADDVRKKLADGSHSDHVMLINAFMGWEEATTRGTNRQYCWQNFLSENTLKLLRDMKKQLSNLLCDLGFLNDKNPKHHAANVNSDNVALVKAVLCAGLYPNVAKVWSPPKKHRPMKLRTKSDAKCELHPKSVNTEVFEPESQWVIYHKMMKTTGVYIYDTSLVSPYPLLFFGGDIRSFTEYDEDHVSVDEWIKFKASPRTASLVKELRKELDKLLQEKIINPGVTDWSANSKEGALLNAIINLVTTEEEKSRRMSVIDYGR